MGTFVPRYATFDFHGVSLRVLTGTKADLWFIAADVCRGLRLSVGAGKSTTRYLTGLDPEERRVVSKLPTLELGAPSVTIISESGLYKLVLRAQRSNPAARKFQDWVTKEVLPAIRKDGGYVMGEEKVRAGEMSEDERRVVSREISRSDEGRTVFAPEGREALLIIEAVLLAISTGGSPTTTPCAEPGGLQEPLKEMAMTNAVTLTTRGGLAWADSREVAKSFEKEHRHVLRDLKVLLDSRPDLGNQWFQEVTAFNEAANKPTRHFEMTRDGFSLLAMGWTGAKALAFKVAYIERFNAMEAALKAQAKPSHVGMAAFGESTGA